MYASQNMSICVKHLFCYRAVDSDSDNRMEFTDDEARTLVDTWVQDLHKQHKQQIFIFLIRQLLQAGMAKLVAYQQAVKAFHMSVNTVQKQQAHATKLLQNHSINSIFWLHNVICINIATNEGKGLFRTTVDRTTEK